MYFVKYFVSTSSAYCSLKMYILIFHLIWHECLTFSSIQNSLNMPRKKDIIIKSVFLDVSYLLYNQRGIPE